MAYLGLITVRTLPVGGAVAAAAATPQPGGRSLLGRRHVVLLVHGFNVNQEDAVAGYNRLFTDLPADVAHFLWPGDARGGPVVSGGSYPFQIRSAQESAVRLAELLKGAFGPEGGPASVSLVGHSLGCRLVLELLNQALASPARFPEFSVVALMAAAVPVALVDRGGGLEAAALSARKLALAYSGKDRVLQLAFPEGQTAARLFGYDTGGVFAGGNYNLAVGRSGEPTRLPAQRGDMTPFEYGHGDYWGPKRNALDFLAPLFDVAVPRTPPVRDTAARTLPAAPALAARAPGASAALPTRALPTRRLS
jgi:hypothetical protein